VVLTIDDGYRDMYLYAYPELRKRNMNATFFVTTRFIEGELWLWPDRLEYALNRTTQQKVTISIDEKSYEYDLSDDAQKQDAWKLCSDYCIGISDHNRLDFINNLEQMLAVESPCSPLQEYAASGWNEICEMHNNGIEIGSHTCNHPILSKIDPALLDREILISKQIIEQQLGSSISSFCYPNSAPGDINDAVVNAVERAGFGAAVFGTDLAKWELFRIPRIGVTNDRNDFLWKLFGLEHSTLQLNRILAGEAWKTND
jgi:peptidoglycan/xylan/chitin deacetylase (PgdA/CDA1 family)